MLMVAEIFDVIYKQVKTPCLADDINVGFVTRR